MTDCISSKNSLGSPESRSSVVLHSNRPRTNRMVYCPDKVVSYAKHHLHPGEEVSFSPGENDCIVDVKGVDIGLAICADTVHASHAQKAADKGADIYAAGVLITEGGYQADAELLRQYARRHNMVVLMANHCAPTGGWAPAGKSAIWDEKGQLVARAGGADKALLIAKKSTNN
jgi:predicted amidohydrolase